MEVTPKTEVPKKEREHIMTEEEYLARAEQIKKHEEGYPKAKEKVYHRTDDIYVGNLEAIENNMKEKLKFAESDKNKLKYDRFKNYWGAYLFDSNALQAAAIKRDLEMMKMIMKYKPHLSAFLYISGALSGDINIVKYIYSIKCPINDFVKNKIEENAYVSDEIKRYVKNLKNPAVKNKK